MAPEIFAASSISGTVASEPDESRCKKDFVVAKEAPPEQSLALTQFTFVIPVTRRGERPHIFQIVSTLVWLPITSEKNYLDESLKIPNRDHGCALHPASLGSGSRTTNTTK